MILCISAGTLHEIVINCPTIIHITHNNINMNWLDIFLNFFRRVMKKLLF